MTTMNKLTPAQKAAEQYAIAEGGPIQAKVKAFLMGRSYGIQEILNWVDESRYAAEDGCGTNIVVSVDALLEKFKGEL